MRKLVRKKLEGSASTPASLARLCALAARGDATIDVSEIPPLDENFWANAVRTPFYRPVKQQLTVRLDADVVNWLRAKGDRYQTRLN